MNTDVAASVDCALLLGLARLGHINLLAAGVSSNNQFAAAAIAALMLSYGVYAPIGVQLGFLPPNAGWPDNTGNPSQAWYLSQNFPTGVVGLSRTMPAAVTNYRKALAAAPNNSVTMIITGPGRNLADLLQSAADSISPLTGLQLVTQKVKVLYAGAGIYPTGSETNFTADAVSGAYYVANWPTPIIFCGIEIGDTFHVATKIDTVKANADILRSVLYYYNGNVANTGRQGWGAVALSHMLLGLSGYTRTQGTNVVNSSSGANTFTANSTGTHYYITPVGPVAKIRDWANAILYADQTQSSFNVAWPYNAALVRLSA